MNELMCDHLAACNTCQQALKRVENYWYRIGRERADDWPNLNGIGVGILLMWIIWMLKGCV